MYMRCILPTILPFSVRTLSFSAVLADHVLCLKLFSEELPEDCSCGIFIDITAVLIPVDGSVTAGVIVLVGSL